jgi:hypothetical protein
VTDNSLHRFAFRDPIVAELLASGIDYYARMTGNPEIDKQLKSSDSARQLSSLSHSRH